MFKKSNDHALYSGQWVQAPARPYVEDEYGVEKELAVIFQIEKNDEVAVFYCLDGAGYYRKQKDLTPYPPNFQSLYTSKQPFQLFKGAVVEGNRLGRVEPVENLTDSLGPLGAAHHRSLQCTGGIFSAASPAGPGAEDKGTTGNCIAGDILPILPVSRTLGGATEHVGKQAEQ